MARGQQFLVDRRRRGVGVGSRVALDAAAASVHIKVAGGELRMSRDDLAARASLPARAARREQPAAAA